MSVSPALDPGLAHDDDALKKVRGSFDPRDIDWRDLGARAKEFGAKVAAHPLSLPAFLAFVGIVLLFWPMIGALPARWNEDQYYSHGWLVPFLSAFIVFRRWPKIKAFVEARPESPSRAGLPVKLAGGAALVALTWTVGGAAYVAYNRLGALGLNSWIGLAAFGALLAISGALYGAGVWTVNRLVGFQVAASAIIVALLPLLYVSYVSNIAAILGVLFVAVSLLTVAVVAGWRWAFALSPAILFFLFALPIWNSFIDGYTNPLQLASTKISYQLLRAFGYGAFQVDPTTVVVGKFTLNVDVPCSGMKLLLAVSAFTTLFVLIAKLKIWSNLIMVSMIVPLCLFVNGLRIALIGVVGAEEGTDAAMQFHDTSGYITLVVCFFLLFKFARLLGWKD